MWALSDWIFLSAEVTKDSFSMRLAQTRQKVTDCCIWPNLYCIPWSLWCANYQFQQRNKKKTSYNFLRFLHMSSWWMTFLRLLHGHVILVNDLAKLHVVCFSNDFPKQAWLIQTSNSLTWTFMWNTLSVFPWRLKSSGDYWHIRDYCFPNCFQEVL